MRFVLILLVAASLAAESVTENYPDGSKSLTVTVDKEGRRNGALTAWWPGGKIVKEKSKWDDGVRHGLTQIFDEKGKQVREETWIKGRLIYPRAQAQIIDAFARIERETQAYVATLPKPINPGSAPPADQAQALARAGSIMMSCSTRPTLTRPRKAPRYWRQSASSIITRANPRAGAMPTTPRPRTLAATAIWPWVRAA